ncbi:AfsR/SARP family transcriptional regulator [Streptomyces sporangiiformans]|uniref:AfsR family transcriptional regulator n=1 Tax=Streptomyces sporangiiformans TaxID=2315329 RepID=A0A505DLJ1_9ACTN|nr:AfsR/SARP family transcriptional regulator [Streptomyces sporangiiformans]TPQ19461.1 AfsR family transcriptional regulator [Streptomyces sporangiiformans]
MRFEVLGTLRVCRGDSELDLGFPQQRALLGLLLVRAGRPVPMSEIVDVLWSERPPASALNVVRRYAGSLRRLLEPSLPPRAPGRRLLRRAGGYLLEAGEDELDLLRFRDLTKRGKRAAATGRPEVALRHFVEALSGWRGPVAMGIPVSVREHAAFAAVERELVHTTVMAADAALLCGRTEQVLPRLRRAVELDPLNEPLHSRLVMSLAAAGLQADALAAYKAVRRLLAEELGVSPGVELSEAHMRVLRQELRPTGSATAHEQRTARAEAPEPVVRPAQLPPDGADFSGRRAELGRLLEIIEAASDYAGAPAGVLISGMAGIGKSTLAIHGAHAVADRFPDGQLHVELRGFDPSRAPLEPAEALRGMLTGLGVSRHLPNGLDALAGLYRSVLSGRRVLILLDDASGTEQVRPLLPASPGCLTLVTSRNGLPSLIASGAHPLRLGLPSAADARAVLAVRIGHERVTAEPAAADEIVERCGRLPLALAIVAARAISRPEVPLAAIAAELRLSEGSLDAFAGTDRTDGTDGTDSTADARTAFACSYRSLPPDSARLFRLLSVHPGPDIATDAAAALADHPARRVRLILDELADAHLLTEHTPGRYTQHDLLRVFAAELSAEHDSLTERQAARQRLSAHIPHTGRV